MTAKSRYWDLERCAWIAYEPTTVATPETLDQALPEQRAEDETAATPADAAPSAAS